MPRSAVLLHASSAHRLENNRESALDLIGELQAAPLHCRRLLQTLDRDPGPGRR